MSGVDSDAETGPGPEPERGLGLAVDRLAALPRLMVLTDRTQVGAGSLVEVVRGVVEAGVRAVVLREKDLPRADRVALADELRPILHAMGGVLLVASDPTIESDGVHLAAADPFPADGERPAIVGRSCHSLADAESADAEGCDYVTISPVFESSSKPGYGPALGLEGLQLVCEAVAVPVYALGGVDAERADLCVEAGAEGVAVMGAVMRCADDPGRLHPLLHAVGLCGCPSHAETLEPTP